VERVRALGVDVHLPTPAEAEQWRIACRRVYARWKVATNAALVTKIEGVVEQSRKSRAPRAAEPRPCRWTARCSSSWCAWST
jgi:hypothetical protein